MVLKKFNLLIVLFFWVFFSSLVNAQDVNWQGTASIWGGLSSNEELPFWFYTNTENRWSENSNISALAETSLDYPLSKNASISGKISGYYRNDVANEFQRKEIFARFTNSWLEASVGAFSTVDHSETLSATHKNFLFSGNARPMPGLLLQASQPLKISNSFAVDWGIGHFQQNDDRFVEDTRIHYKRLGLWVNFNEKNRLKLQLQHYAQWAGTSPVFGDLNDDFEAFVDVFTARKSSEIGGDGEILNAVGNHLGSYLFDYYTDTSFGSFNFYHEHPFEDGSGTAFKNFPDGVWGLAYKSIASKWLQGVSYEFITTKDQSGPERPDGYFSNNIYRSGWAYEGNTIGLPFIGVDRNVVVNDINSPFRNNRIEAHHLAATGTVKNLEWLFKTTFLKNFGTYRIPFEPPTKARYHFIQLKYSTPNWGQIMTMLGWDALDTMSDTIGLGAGYQYSF